MYKGSGERTADFQHRQPRRAITSLTITAKDDDGRYSRHRFRGQPHPPSTVGFFVILSPSTRRATRQGLQ